jgi:hypothetical protein
MWNDPLSPGIPVCQACRRFLALSRVIQFNSRRAGASQGVISGVEFLLKVSLQEDCGMLLGSRAMEDTAMSGFQCLLFEEDESGVLVSQ